MDLMTGLVDYMMPSWGNIVWPSEVSDFLMGILKIKHIALKHCFGLNTFWEIVYGNCIFPKKCHVVTLMDMIVYEKCIIFVISYREMHDLLAWKWQASLI